MQLSYKAIGKNGEVIKGVIEARNASEAAKFLRSKELLPTIIAPVTHVDIFAYLPFIKKVSDGDIVFFTRQIASMLTSGLTLMQALHVLKEQVQKSTMKTMIQDIISDVEQGNTFSTALSRYPETFTGIYISLISAAETSGLMDKALLRLAENLEKQQQLKSTIKGALIYPIIILCAMVVVIAIMLIFVIPQLSTLYEGLNVELPWTTKLVLGLSSFTINYWPLAIGLFVVTVLIFYRWQKTTTGKLVIDDLSLRLPVFGQLIQKTMLAEFTRTLGLLIGSGNLVVASLLQSADSAGNILYKNAIISMSQRVEKGIAVGDSMAISAIFPPILVQSVKIGEQTGKLDESLLRVSDYFDREVSQTVKNLTTLMEPMIMIVLGIGVAFLIISIITPIYSITNAIR